MKEKPLNQHTGITFLIQRFSVQDGPGMRATVFTKGCPLSCWWCQNPESIHSFPELMVNVSACRMFGKCLDVCPVDAISIDPKQGKTIDRDKCNRCFDCVNVCPTGSLKRVGKYMTVKQVLEEIEKDEIFYRKSNGGVTISGGEPLFQEAFVYSLLQACKQRGFHTALDTSGYAPWQVFKKVLDYVDLILYDIKHMNSKAHKKATGQPNDLILSNFHKIPSRKIIWLRIPLIAGFNDTEENLKKVAELGREKEVEKVSILPLHKLGEGKYIELDKKYLIREMEIPSKEKIAQAKQFLEDFGLQVTIGE